MARLFTHHDPYCVHTLIGVAVLLHFAYRFYCVCCFGVTFPTGEPLVSSSGLVLLRGLRAVSAFIPPVPCKRLYTAPMVWPEFRMYGSLFAMWHVCATLLTLHNLWLEGVISNAAAWFSFLALRTIAASVITHQYGGCVYRTTNCMPYPSWFNWRRRRWKFTEQRQIVDTELLRSHYH